MEKIDTIINIDEIKEFLTENLEDLPENEHEDFVRYLEVDFYDWLQSNLNSFLLQKQS